jgi:hypothetical protein
MADRGVKTSGALKSRATGAGEVSCCELLAADRQNNSDKTLPTACKAGRLLSAKSLLDRMALVSVLRLKMVAWFTVLVFYRM